MEKENLDFPKIFLSFWQFWGLVLTPNFPPRARMDLLDWFFSVSIAHNFANLDFSFSNEVTLIFSINLLRGGTPGLEVPYLHSTTVLVCERGWLELEVQTR